jgi:gluconolactonase
MDGFDIRSPRFARYILSNAALEALATGFRWIEGPVWMGDANCLLFQDLPNDRTMRWIEGQGVSVYRAPSHYANGQTRDRQGRLIACSHRGRCLYRTEYDGRVTTLIDRHAGKRLNSPNDVVSNVTFAGPAKNRLFIGGSTTLYAIFLNCRGVQVP